MSLRQWIHERTAPRGAAGIRREPRGIEGTALRAGMWVMVDLDGRQKPAIALRREGDTNLSRLMLVDPDSGENRVELAVGQGIVRQARLGEIPARRRPPAELAASLGYHR